MNREGDKHADGIRPRLNHETPVWIRDAESIFFITISCKERGSNQLAKNPIGDLLIESINYRNESKIWWCSSFVVMPDHVHALIQFTEDLPMVRAIRAWKSWTAKEYGAVWQSQWFEHRLRDNEAWREKSTYILNNPVRSGLVKNSSEWRWFYTRQR